MAALIPFRALRPTAEAAALVAAVPYDVVNTDEARALAAGNPLSFLHVSRAEIDLPPGTSPHTDEVYARAAANFVTLLREAPLQTDEVASLYVYRLRMGAHTQTGVAACFSVDEYERNAIRRHELTRPDKEDDRTRHLLDLRAQTGPVFLTHGTNQSIEQLVSHATAAAPLFDFTAADQIGHTIWRVDQRTLPALVDAFAHLPALYIADGHHRAAAAARARTALGGASNPVAECNAFLAVAFPDVEVQVLPYNRVVRDLRGLSPEAFLDRLRERVSVEDGSATPRGKGEFSLFVAGRWFALRPGEPPADASAADRLDVSRLEATVLGPVLGITNVRSDPRIEFIGGARGTAELERLVTTGRAAAAFSMHPVGVDDLMGIADAGGIMPPKSTWFEPKLRDGLLIHAI